MASLHDQMTAAASPVLSHYTGEAVTYTPPSGAAVAVTGALVLPVEVKRIERDGRQMVRFLREISLPIDQVAAVVTLAEITIDGKAYKVAEILGRSGSWTRVVCVRWVAAELAHSEYRADL